MRGQILGVDSEGGVILGEDGARLGFTLADWRSSPPPQVGQSVDYLVDEEKAKNIYLIPNPAQAAPAPPHTSGAFVLGAVGVACLALGLVIPVLPTVVAFILGVIGAERAQLERDASALTVSRIAWIGALVLFGLGLAAILIMIAFFGGVLGLMMHLTPNGVVHT